MSRFIYRHSKLLAAAHLAVQIQNNITRFCVTSGYLLKKRENLLERIGTSYGGWWAPILDSGSKHKKFLLSAGLGFDTTFDKGMAERGFFVLGLDPLIECCDEAQKALGDHKNMLILNKGLATFEGHQTFYEPRNPNHDSWSTINVQEVSGSVSRVFEVISISSLLRDIPEFVGADYRYLKMDIEGAELDILEKTHTDLEVFDFVGIEMDFLSLIPFANLRTRYQRIIKARAILKSFQSAGFDLIKLDNFNFFWSKS
jgi:FkbM family methyltransferase